MSAAEVTALATRATGLDDEQLALLKRTICENATDDEYRMFAGICKRSGLDPFSKQIYFRKYNTQQGPRVTIITGIDGYRLIAQRTGEYEGQTEPEWCGSDGVWKQVWLDSKPPAAARVGVWRRGFKQPAYAIAKWTEYYPSNPKERFMWDKMPSNQISKCAEALSLRKAFPQELSGIYTSDEMAQAGMRPAATVEVVEPTDPETNETIRGALGEAPKAAPSAAAPATAATTSKPPRANTVKHDGTFASHKQVTLLHILRSKVGGLDVCDKDPCYDDNGKRINPKRGMCSYHKQLAGFKDCDDRPVITSKDLSEAQISNLIDRYEAKIKQQEARAAELPDLGAIDAATEKQIDELSMAIAGVEDSEKCAELICETFKVMTIADLQTKDRVSGALAVAMAYGTKALEPLLAKIQGQA